MADLKSNLLYQQAKRCVAARNFAHAEDLCRKLLRRNKRDHNALQILGSCAYAGGLYDKAAKYFKQCVALCPHNPLYQCQLALLQVRLGQYDKALASYDRALKIKPNDAVAIGGKASALERSGDHEAARALLEPYVEAGSEDAVMALTYARLEYEAGRYVEAIAAAKHHVGDPKVEPAQRRGSFFIIGKSYEKSGRFEEGFKAFQKANQLLAPSFAADEWRQQIDELIETFSGENLARFPQATNESELPVFVVGMPRCGSTLVEKIISAHPQAYGAGEIHVLGDITNSMMFDLGAYQTYPRCMEDLTQSWADQLAAKYLDQVKHLDNNAVRVVDKMLSNHRHLGLIAILLPRARVIHCRRDPMDTCWSCFAENLAPDKHRYASDLKNLGLVYRQYERLMDHWKQVLDIPFIEVVYEQMVADQEGVSRRVIEFLGLPWDERCLRFYESDQSAQTLSYQQVRQPMYKSALRRHEKYGALLDPLRDALRGEGEPPTAR